MFRYLYNDADSVRILPEPPKDAAQRSSYRSEFRKDYGRLIHSAGFRRLQGKTQLFPTNDFDYFRSRLTHSLEVAQIANCIARKLNQQVPNFAPPNQIDLDLIDAACLAHDIGHPPFGHNGEKILNDYMAHAGGFEGNAQTLRLIARLERKVEAQFAEFVSSVAIPKDFEDWIIREGLQQEKASKVPAVEIRESLQLSISETERQINTLTDLRVQGYIDEKEFSARREKLQGALLAARDRLTKVERDEDWFEPLESLISFSSCAVPWLLHGDDETKRIIVKTVGSNPTLLDKKLSITKAKPFVALSSGGQIPEWGDYRESNPN